MALQYPSPASLPSKWAVYFPFQAPVRLAEHWKDTRGRTTLFYDNPFQLQILSLRR